MTLARSAGERARASFTIFWARALMPWRITLAPDTRRLAAAIALAVGERRAGASWARTGPGSCPRAREEVARRPPGRSGSRREPRPRPARAGTSREPASPRRSPRSPCPGGSRDGKRGRPKQLRRIVTSRPGAVDDAIGTARARRQRGASQPHGRRRPPGRWHRWFTRVPTERTHSVTGWRSTPSGPTAMTAVMTEPAEDLLELALVLPPKERARLAKRLLDSLEPDPEVESAWAAEVRLRIRQIESGEVQCQDWEEALDDVERSLKR